MAKKSKSADPVLDTLRKAARGLRWPSETDAPLEPVAWEGSAKLTKKKLLELAGAESGAAVEEVPLDAAFATVSQEDRPKFDELRQAPEGQLSGLTAYKVGDEPEKQLFLVGKAPDGRWAGLKTTVVET
jgi:histidine triad (HIT) family protein